ncbi:hypothetical protein GWI33_005365 [Rhynchophorus ferrugineus]|uniref:Peptidase S1 domain-containing protein n=1 Tax=Rhynchophorus ferrugineus TaxID=354439 RepID=A0A834IHK0_RHYFE|nr:hypothetical protein GWI33_005365 [Rhynchophorus ferrugineus]
MKIILVLGACVALCFAAPGGSKRDVEEYVRYQPKLDGRIVGGVLANISDLPYQVALLKRGVLYCGGSIIAARTILTAAHCVAFSYITVISQLSIRAGSNRNDTGGSVIQANGRVIHSQYNDCPNCTPVYDIAAVFLKADAVGAGGVASIIPLASTVPAVGTLGVVSGWGYIRQGGPGSFMLRRVDVPIMLRADCSSAYNRAFDSTTVCAGYVLGRKDACQGDSGGPFVIDGELVGIVSWGIGCARAGYPGVYTSVPGLRTWITNNVGV